MLGVGTLGSIFATRLLDAGITVHVFDIDRARVDALVGRGAIAAASLSALGDAGTVLVSLPDPAASAKAVLGDTGLIASCPPGTLIIDTSTIDPSTARAIAGACGQRGIDYVEAPLSGGDEEGSGVDAARTGATTFICGGEPDAIERARPLLGRLGRHVIHVGAAGEGAVAKLVSNHMAGLHNLVASEALAVGRAAGLSLDMMLEVLRHTDGKSYWLTHYMVRRLHGSDIDGGFSIDLQRKDHRLFGELATSLGVRTPLNDTAIEVYDGLRHAGLGAKDLTEAAQVAAEQAGLPRYGQ
jgi:3-hydroxyisobutyrate dehydrogenase-like beta-hydroxyacid dehydrogenase